jgi:hypothetical protein
MCWTFESNCHFITKRNLNKVFRNEIITDTSQGEKVFGHDVIRLLWMSF